MPTCRELGIAFLAYSPLGGSGYRGVLRWTGHGTGESSAGRIRGEKLTLGGSEDRGVLRWTGQGTGGSSAGWVWGQGGSSAGPVREQGSPSAGRVGGEMNPLGGPGDRGQRIGWVVDTKRTVSSCHCMRD